MTESTRTRIVVYLDADTKRRLRYLAADQDTTITKIALGFIKSGLRRAKTAPPPPHHPEPPPVPEPPL
jgi:hypothetical protein